MIPALSLMVGAYIVARLVEVAGRDGVKPGVYWISLLACIIAMGSVAYIFLLAEQASDAATDLQDAIRNLGY